MHYSSIVSSSSYRINPTIIFQIQFPKLDWKSDLKKSIIKWDAKICWSTFYLEGVTSLVVEDQRLSIFLSLSLFISFSLSFSLSLSLLLFLYFSVSFFFFVCFSFFICLSCFFLISLPDYFLSLSFSLYLSYFFLMPLSFFLPLILSFSLSLSLCSIRLIHSKRDIVTLSSSRLKQEKLPFIVWLK